MANTPFVDQEGCIGCRLCVIDLPDVFRLAPNGKAEVHDPAGAPMETIQKKAIDICPVSCIRWHESPI